MSTNRRVFLKQLGLATVGTGILASHTDEIFASKLKFTLPRSMPEQQGISSSGILNFIEALEKSNMEFHSIMIVRHGHVVAEGWWAPYAPELKHTLYSLSKSFTSTAIGLAISEGKFKLDSRVVSFFPDDVPKEISGNLAAMTVQSLLTMSSGHAKDTIPLLRASNDPDWVKTFLSLPVEFQPGTHFIYNTGATYMLSAIIQKVTGQTTEEYLKPRLFEPLGTEDYDWEKSKQGITTGGYGLRIRTEDIAKFGQMYLQKGMWDGKQVVPASWIADATASHIDNKPAEPKIPNEVNDWAQGYCYQFWRCTHNAVRADGAFGQFCIMMPDNDTMVVITEESFKTQETLNIVWSELLPAIKGGVLPADDMSHKKLQQRLKTLAIEPLKTNSSSPVAAKVSDKEFILTDNEFKAKSVSFRFSEGSCLFKLKDDKGEYSVNCGINKWKEERNYKTQTIFPMAGRPVVTTPLVASATWVDPNTLMMTWRYVATAHSDTIYCQFEDNSVGIKFLSSVSKGNPTAEEKRKELHGVAS
jgi:CubicO group peptidase (beta-lactamase class C family)